MSLKAGQMTRWMTSVSRGAVARRLSYHCCCCCCYDASIACVTRSNNAARVAAVKRTRTRRRRSDVLADSLLGASSATIVQRHRPVMNYSGATSSRAAGSGRASKERYTSNEFPVSIESLLSLTTEWLSCALLLLTMSCQSNCIESY